jgi:hypothetical protein
LSAGTGLAECLQVSKFCYPVPIKPKEAMREPNKRRKRRISNGTDPECMDFYRVAWV